MSKVQISSGENWGCKTHVRYVMRNGEKILQVPWTTDTGKVEWRDVETVTEDKTDELS